MTDFPTALSNVLDNMNSAQAKYVNNLETKVGIDDSTDTTSLDYLVKSRGKNICQYGAVGDGVTDNYALIQAILDAGERVFIPNGVFGVSQPLQFHDESMIVGNGRRNSEIKMLDAGTYGAAHGLLEPDDYAAPGETFPRMSRAYIAHLSLNGNKANNATELEGIVFGRITDGLIFDVETYNCSGVGINTGAWYATGGQTDFLQCVVSHCFMHDCAEGFQGIGGLVIACTAYKNTTAGYSFVLNGNTASEWDLLDTIVIGCVADNNGSDGFFPSYQAGTARVCPMEFIGCQATKNGTFGFSSTLKHIMFKGGLSAYNSSGGVFLGQTDHNKVLGMIIKNNTGPAMMLDRGNNHLQIASNHIIDDQAVKTQTYFIEETNDLGSANNLIHHNIIDGYATGVFNAAVTTGNDYDIRNNIGYNPVGLSAITPTGSPYTYTCGTSPEEVYIYGGTVSDVKRGSTTVATSSPCRVSLEPGQTLVVTYSSAPTMIKDVK